MDFQKLTDAELDKINQDYYPKYGQYLEDISLSNEQKSIAALLKRNKIKNPDEEKQNLHAFLKEYLMRKIKELALIEYLIMDKSKNFGTMGEQRVSISFCRNILKIPNDREVTQFDADRFRRIIEEFDEKNSKKSAEQYATMLKQGFINFLGIKIKVSLMDPLQNYFKYLELPYYFYFTYTAHKYTNFIFGELVERGIGDYKLGIFEKEYVRSPSFVLSIAAENAPGNMVMIRRESCEVIFYNKWQRFFDQSKSERKKALNHKNSAIREGVKEKAMELYAVKTVEDVKKIKTLFIDEMIDGILWHEAGHKVSKIGQDSLLSKFGSSVFESTDKVPSILNEALGDWAPEKGALKGAISRFVEIAKTDKNKAARDIYVYLSDNWFVDEEEEFMSLQSDVLTSLMLHFINSDGSIDFDRLSKEKDKIYDFCLKVYSSVMQNVFSIIKSGSYTLGMHKLNYEALQKEIFKIYKEEKLVSTENELFDKGPFWINLWGYVKKFSPETHQKINEYLDTASNDLRDKILKVISKGDPTKYNNSLREYIYQRYKEIGIIKDAPKISWESSVSKACDAMKMPDKIKSKVQEQFEKIIKGDNYDISINYEGEKDPFLAVIQEMMIKSGYGDIKAGMFLGEMYDAEEPIEKRKEYIKNELENIRDQIESEMYMDVDKLRVNKKYNAKPMVEELLETVAFFDSKKLKEKIREVVYEDFTSEALFEALIPLKRGFMDWNTSQAVWRINQDIRPDEFIMQWTIDREFIEALVEVYQ